MQQIERKTAKSPRVWRTCEETTQFPIYFSSKGYIVRLNITLIHCTLVTAIHERYKLNLQVLFEWTKNKLMIILAVNLPSEVT